MLHELWIRDIFVIEKDSFSIHYPNLDIASARSSVMLGSVSSMPHRDC
jgi:hypothetical protein